MDQIGLQQQKNNYQTTLKKVTKLLFSLSLFSFFFALPYSCLPLHFSTLLPFHLFHQPIDKNCMFLLCNGLLVFLANYSGLFKSLSSSRRNYDSFRVFEFGPLSDPMMLEAEKPLLERETTKVITTSREREEDGYVTPQEKQKDESAKEDGYELGTDFLVAERAEIDNTTTNYEEEEEGNSGVLSDEELNKKFDEFIKRMKEEITVDARRTLVVV